MRRHREKRLNREEAEAIAVAALAFLADRPEALGRFLALTGIGPANLRLAAGSPSFLAGVIDFLLGDEPLLVAFAGDAGLPPEAIAGIARLLGSAA